MSRQAMSDWLLVGAIALGLAFSWALPLIFVALAVRLGASQALRRIQWNAGHVLQLASIAWALGIIVTRGVGSAQALLLQYAFIWVLPLYFAVFRPTQSTVERYQLLVFAVFALDLAFNFYSLATGQDLLGRVVDERAGVAGGRNGGLFSHSFYSGSISILAYATFIAQPKLRPLIPLAVINFLLAGSWRILVALVLLPALFWRYRQRKWRQELLWVGLVSTGIIGLVFVTSSVFQGDFGVEPNPANDLRIVAWVTALDKISESPWTGVGYPNDKPTDGVNADEIDDLLIAESWYLGAMITFGLPYALLRLGAYLLAFYRRGYSRRSAIEAMLVPFALIDFTYGGFVEGVLVYTWLWILIESRSKEPT